eukprot:TRINITY_DN452_c0_g2_i1.p2 TRINITY_DN452_c0_g2~~TRINITY_DN452_c0_g2_i1.p2  ORF type:complete len:108 (+),score=1.32 TRINITY_DN452_c0_g2_i1:115-438(+)
MKILAVVLLLVCLFAKTQGQYTALQGCLKDYKIQKGDTLSHISESCIFEVPISEIILVNSGKCTKSRCCGPDRYFHISRDLILGGLLWALVNPLQGCTIRIPCHCYP